MKTEILQAIEYYKTHAYSIYFAGITECYDISIKDEIICVDLTHQH